MVAYGGHHKLIYKEVTKMKMSTKAESFIMMWGDKNHNFTRGLVIKSRENKKFPVYYYDAILGVVEDVLINDTTFLNEIVLEHVTGKEMNLEEMNENEKELLDRNFNSYKQNVKVNSDDFSFTYYSPKPLFKYVKESSRKLFGEGLKLHIIMGKLII